MIAGENDRWKISQQHDSQNRVVRRTIEKKGGVTPWKFDSETIFVYDGWSILEERTTNSAGDKTIRRYVHGPATDEILRQDFFSSGGSIKSVYHHHDLLGSNLCLSDSTGNAVEYCRYTEFGFPTILDTNLNAIPATKFGNRHLYTGREWLRELSLADHRNRHYTPPLARWTSTDPIKFDAGDVNLYRYCGDEIVRKSDGYGMRSFEIKGCNITLVVKVKLNFLTGFDSERESYFREEFKKTIESTWNTGIHKIFPTKNTYRAAAAIPGHVGTPRTENNYCCPCLTEGFTPRIFIEFSNFGSDVKANIESNISLQYKRSSASLGFSGSMFLDEADIFFRKDIHQIPAAHEFGHVLGIRHLGDYLSPPMPPATFYSADHSARMVSGMELRPSYFDGFKEYLNNRHNGCEYATH